MKCQKIFKRHRKSSIGHMRDRIKLLPRAITEPLFGITDFTETFTDVTETWANVTTTNGESMFDGVNTDVSITHEVFIRFDSSITEEAWVRLDDGTLLNIVSVENFEKRSEFMRLVCNERGDESLGAAQA